MRLSGILLIIILQISGACVAGDCGDSIGNLITDHLYNRKKQNDAVRNVVAAIVLHSDSDSSDSDSYDSTDLADIMKKNVFKGSGNPRLVMKRVSDELLEFYPGNAAAIEEVRLWSGVLDKVMKYGRTL
jgi:hypothetical protein